MFFYNFDTLNDFINISLQKNIEEEKYRLSNISLLYDEKRINLLNITNNMISVTDVLKKDKLDAFYKVISLLKNSFESLDNIVNYLKILNNNLENILSLLDNIEINFNEIKANLVEYNKHDEKLYNQIFAYEKNITNILNLTVELTIEITNLGINTNFNDELNCFSKKVITDNNTLLVSEKDQKAYLPYKYAHIKEIFKNSSGKYCSLEDIVEKLYVISLDRFKNSSFSRFREGFNLIRNKENASITKALDLGLELMFKYDLNPIIISACRNLDELDIYLDCLENNELYDFDCFEIKFEVAPQISKSNIEKYK